MVPLLNKTTQHSGMVPLLNKTTQHSGMVPLLNKTTQHSGMVPLLNKTTQHSGMVAANNRITTFEGFYIHIYIHLRVNEPSVFQPCRRPVSWRARCSSGSFLQTRQKKHLGLYPTDYSSIIRPHTTRSSRPRESRYNLTFDLMVACPEHVYVASLVVCTVSQWNMYK